MSIKITPFFISNTFISNILAWTFAIWKLLTVFIYARMRTHAFSNKLKNKCVCIHEIIWVIMMKMKMKNGSHRYINRPRSRHGHKIVNIKSLSVMMLLCIKQHLSNIRSSVHKKLSNTEAEIKTGVAYKKACNLRIISSSEFKISQNVQP